MPLLIFIIVVSPFLTFSQNHIEPLLDSLTLVKSHDEKVRISNKIAWELKDTDWERTLNYLNYSEEQSLASKSENTFTLFYMAAGNIYYDKDVLDVALEYYQKAYTIYQNQNNIQESFKLENNLAIIYAKLKNKDKALFYFKKVYHFQAHQNDSIYLAQILNNIGTLYIDLNIDSSLVYYYKSLEIAKQLHDINMFAYLYPNLGRVYSLKDDLEKAQIYFNKANALTNGALNDDLKSMVFQFISEYHMNRQQNDSAILYAQKAVELLNQDLYSFNYQNIIKVLYQAYYNEEDYQNAAKYFVIYDAVRDSINVEEKAVNVERLKLELEYQTKDQIRALKEKKAKFGYIIIGLSLVSGLLILIIILARYKNRLAQAQLENKLSESQKEELNAKLELKNNLLIAKAMTEIHRTEIIQEILEELKQVKLKAAKKETQHAIDFISHRLTKDIDTNIWNEFELSFEQVHESFYKNLNLKHSELTTSDRRLCALLKLNLTSKEISQITGQSYKSVENSRTRLRKKLSLTNTKTDLVVYLNTLD